MSHHRQFAKLVASISLSTLCGCTEPVYEKLFSTDHFDYYIEQGATPPCDGTGEWLERYYNANAKFLGAELPAGEKIEYYYIENGETRLLECGEGAGGCTKETKIFMNSRIDAHEIVHANAFLLGDPPLLFQEGLAVVLGCATGTDRSGPLDLSAPIETLLETTSFANWRRTQVSDVYSASGSFVRYLIDTYGAAKFLAFYARGQRDASSAETKDIFAEEMGLPLDDAFSDWRKLPPSLPSNLCLRLMECDPSMKTLMSDDVDLECGPWSNDVVAREALFRFQVNEHRTKVITTTPEIAEPQPWSIVELYSCTNGNVMAGGDASARFLVSSDLHLSIDPAVPSNSFVLDVPAGEYVAAFSAPKETTIHVELNESMSPMRDGCTPGAEPLLLHENVQTILTSRWMERPCSGFWCPGHSWDVALGAARGAIEVQPRMKSDKASASPDKLYLCSDPCPTDASQCETLTLDVSTGRLVQSKQIFEPGTIVHVGAPLAPLKEHFSVRLRLVPPCNGRVPCTDPWHGPR